MDVRHPPRDTGKEQLCIYIAVLLSVSLCVQEGGPVRFSLEGLVIPRGTALPSHIGLHHHGEKPQVSHCLHTADPAMTDWCVCVLQAAGYTLQELLGLVRSAVLQQRVLSLTTLAKIMRRVSPSSGSITTLNAPTSPPSLPPSLPPSKAWCGEYRGILSHCVLSALCDAGLPLMLRYAVDDSSTPVIAAALASLHSLLVPQWEEVRGGGREEVRGRDGGGEGGGMEEVRGREGGGEGGGKEVSWFEGLVLCPGF